MGNIDDFWTDILKMDKDITEGQQKCVLCEKPSICREVFLTLLLHFIALALFVGLMAGDGLDGLNTVCCVTLIICALVAWMTSFIVTMVVLIRRYRADMQTYERYLNCVEREMEAHNARLFKCFDDVAKKYLDDWPNDKKQTGNEKAK